MKNFQLEFGDGKTGVKKKGIEKEGTILFFQNNSGRKERIVSIDFHTRKGGELVTQIYILGKLAHTVKSVADGVIKE